MKKLFLLLIPVLMGLTACDKKLTVEQAESAVIRGEKDRIAFILQSMPLVDDITIDSIRINVIEEPMQGYLYTTWKSGKTKKKIIVPVSDIRSSKERKGYVEWQSDWESAAKAYVWKSLGL